MHHNIEVSHTILKTMLSLHDPQLCIFCMCDEKSHQSVSSSRVFRYVNEFQFFFFGSFSSLEPNVNNCLNPQTQQPILELSEV